MKKLFVFDYDNTIAKPEQKPTQSMLQLLSTFLKDFDVAIMTGGRDLYELNKLLVEELDKYGRQNRKNLFLCTAYGNLIYKVEDTPLLLYKSEDIPSEERSRIKRIFEEIDWEDFNVTKIHGEQITDKGSVISIDCLGKDAGSSTKDVWDKGQYIREEIKEGIAEALGASYHIFVTGRNTLDIVPKDKDKGSNILKLIELLRITKDEVLFMGDEFTSNGNDYPILSIGIDIKAVENPSETESILKSYL